MKFEDFLLESKNEGIGYIFVYHQSDFKQEYEFEIYPSIVLSLKEFETLQYQLDSSVAYQIIPLLLSRGYIFSKLEKMTHFNIHEPFIMDPSDITTLIRLLRKEGRKNVWVLHPRNRSTLIEDFRNRICKEDDVLVIDEPYEFKGNEHLVLLMMSQGEHYHELMSKIPEGVSVSKILPHEKKFRDYLISRIKHYRFEVANANDLFSVYNLMNDRMDWMVEKGIKQWDKEHYWGIYPKSYYEQMVQQKQLYVLRQDEQVVGAIVLYEEDERWMDGNENAYYLHQLVTSLTHKGIGKKILKEVEKLAIKNKKEFLRLDCIADNEFLNGYYESLGYHFVGDCFEGIYHGHLREKKM